MKRACRSRSGFTLVELMIVTGVMAVLFAILVPAIKTVRENARRAMCAANLHRIYEGALQYANRYDGALPGMTQWAMHDSYSDGDPGPIPWAAKMHEEMFNYVDGRLMRCPSDISVEPVGDFLAEQDWRDTPPYKPQPGHNHTSYFTFMGVAVHPDAVTPPNSSVPDYNLYPPLISPNGLKRGCIYDNANLGVNRLQAPIHVANLKDVADPKQILMMDRYYSLLQTGYYYDYGPQSVLGMRLVSNHATTTEMGTNPIMVVAAGTNILTADGSVRWMNTKSDVSVNDPNSQVLVTKILYHKDYYYTYYVDIEFNPKNWRKK